MDDSKLRDIKQQILSHDRTYQIADNRCKLYAEEIYQVLTLQTTIS